MERRAPHRIRERADVAAGERAEGDRCIGRPESGRAELGDGDAAGRGQQRLSGDVAGLALVRAHAEGGVALEVLD